MLGRISLPAAGPPELVRLREPVKRRPCPILTADLGPSHQSLVCLLNTSYSIISVGLKAGLTSSFEVNLKLTEG